MPRRTVNFPDELYKKIQRIRGRQIAESGKALPFSRAVVQLLAQAITATTRND